MPHHPFLALLRPPEGVHVDFTQPAGAPALAPADGISWQLFANPVSLFIGGVTAVLLELAEPSVRTGVWEHSSFVRDPVGRLHRTGYAALVTVYAPHAAARAMIAGVVQRHAQVYGHTPDGLDYHANDPRLLNWVQATAIFGFTQAYDQFVRRLTLAERNAAFSEGQASAQLYGATGLPQHWPAWEALWASTAPQLQGHAILAEFLDTLDQAPLLPGPLRAVQRLLVRAAVSITPAPVRHLPQLQGRGLRVGEATAVRGLAQLGRIPLPGQPPHQARRRMQAAPAHAE